MHTTKMIVTVAIAPLFLAGIAIAETFTFAEVENPTWDDRINWLPIGGPPGAGDTAIIPSGETCIVRDANQAAKIIQVSGTLGIEGKALVIGDTPGSTTTSTLDGTIYFKKVGSVVGRLEIEGTITMNGTGGLITAKADDGREGLIKPKIADQFAVPKILVVTSDITITGTIKIISGLELNGTAVVDDSNDVMTLGETAGMVWGGSFIKGSGAFEVSAGLLQVNIINFGTPPSPLWDLSGGEIDVFAGSSILKIPITMTGGLLDLNATFKTTAKCIFSGGTIDVADGKVAEFIRP